MIRTLVADDSPAFREALSAVLREDPEFQVVGAACDGADAVQMARLHRPDLIVMDVVMPRMSGLTATAEIMSQTPCAVVVMSRLVEAGAQQVIFEALRAGAVEVVGKPRDLRDARTREELRGILKAMSSVKVVRHRRPPAPEEPLVHAHELGIVAIGSSTGGPPALREILGHLPASFPGAVLVAQHLAAGFTVGLRRWLAGCLELEVDLVERTARMLPGHVYLPVDDHHLLVEGRDLCSFPAAGESPVPGVNRLFDSLLEAAPRVCAVLLTGMGTDGAEGLKRLHERGCHTIVQDEESSLIYGMPRAAKELGAAVEQLPLQSIGPRLRAMFSHTGQGLRQS